MYNTVKSPSKGNKCHAARGVYKKLSIFHRPKWWWIKQMWSDYLEVYPRQGCVQSCMKSWQKGEVIVPFKSKLYFGTKIDCPLLRRVVVKTFNTALLENAFIFCCLMYFGTSYLSIVIYKLVVYTFMMNIAQYIQNNDRTLSYLNNLSWNYLKCLRCRCARFDYYES